MARVEPLDEAPVAPPPASGATARIMPVAGTLGRGGARIDEPPPPRPQPVEPPAGPPVDLETAWDRTIGRLQRRTPGGPRYMKVLPQLHPVRLEGSVVVLHKPPDASRLVDSILADRYRLPIEEELARHLQRRVRVVLETSATPLPVREMPRPEEAPTADVALVADRETAGPEPSGVDDDEALREAMEAARPARERLEKILAEDDELRRATQLICEMFDGRIVRLNDEDVT